MNEIKVTVSYEKPTTSKFDALMAEYEAAKKYADETVAYYKPLADAAEEAKFDAIMKQLEPIKEYAKRISEIKNGETVWIIAYLPISICGGCDGEKFSVVYRPKEIYKWTFSTKYGDFERKNIRYYTNGSHNFIGMWDEWGVYNKLEEEAFKQLREAINEQKSRANREINRLNNITKGGN